MADGFEFNDPVGNCSVGHIFSHIDDYSLYSVVLDNGVEVVLRNREFAAIYPLILPNCQHLWSFKDPHDILWLERDGLRALSNCDFRVYKSNAFGYFFGFDDTEEPYINHWIPLYQMRRKN